jgi:glycosyltransferase involved in cell wall biosynthesis
MVLLEAMAVGLPAIAYDCPCGPRAIITEGENGFLIPDGNENIFVTKLSLLLQNEALRVQMGNNASKITAKYYLETVMLQWQNLFETVAKKIN